MRWGGSRFFYQHRAAMVAVARGAADSQMMMGFSRSPIIDAWKWKPKPGVQATVPIRYELARAALPRQRRRTSDEQRIARVGPASGPGPASQTATAPKHFSSNCNSTALAAPHPATFCLFVRSTLLSVVNMADISTLSKLLEASLDPRQNKQGRSLFLRVFTCYAVPHCPSLPALELQTPH